MAVVRPLAVEDRDGADARLAGQRGNAVALNFRSGEAEAKNEDGETVYAAALSAVALLIIIVGHWLIKRVTGTTEIGGGGS